MQEFTFGNIFAMLLCAFLSVLIPAAAAIIYKIRRKAAPISALLTGAGVFVIFAMILEQLLHQVVLPLVSGSTAGYVLYGAFAAGIFEETGRFLAFKTVLKRRQDPETAVMFGIGHGGCEAILILGMTMLSGAIIAVSVNSMGMDKFVSMSTVGHPELEDAVRAQIEGYRGFGLGSVPLPIFERCLSMIFHVEASILVFESAKVRGKTWLFPVCILLHALLDCPAALWQRGAISSIAILYALMAVVIVCTGVAARRAYKRIEQFAARD